MKISDATDLRNLLDGVYSFNSKKDLNIPHFKEDYQKAISSTFESEFHSRSAEVSKEILPLEEIKYQIIPSVSAVSNYIGQCWGEIYKYSILITDNESFSFASEIFSEFKDRKPIEFINISHKYSENDMRTIIKTIEKNNEVKYIVGLGGGRVMDIQKFIGFKTNVTMVAFPTSLASHVYASPKIHALPVIKKFGYDLTIDGAAPHFTLLDLYLLQRLFNRNPRLIYAGLGDISAFYTAKSDWMLSLKKNHKDRNYFVEILIDQIIDWLGTFPINNDFLEWSKQYHLCQVLLCNITDWEGSPPASGSEHLFALSVEKYAKPNVPLHGELVALGVIIMSLIQKNDYKYISQVIKKLKLSMSLKKIGIDKSMVLSGLRDSLEKGLKKNRHTILNEIDEEEIQSKYEKVVDQLMSEKIISN